mgnify:CR=1 FL=1
MKNRDGSEANDHWATPSWLYKQLDDEFHFDFDPCPLNSAFDGLAVAWGKSNFINPPYNRKDKPRFIKRAFEEWKKGATCVLLIPAAVSTSDFHDLIYPHAEIRFLRGRVAFVGTNTKGEKVTTKKGKHDSMVCIFRAKPMDLISADSHEPDGGVSWGGEGGRTR